MGRSSHLYLACTLSLFLQSNADVSRILRQLSCDWATEPKQEWRMSPETWNTQGPTERFSRQRRGENTWSIPSTNLTKAGCNMVGTWPHAQWKEPSELSSNLNTWSPHSHLQAVFSESLPLLRLGLLWKGWGRLINNIAVKGGARRG